jgi:hypothetical protein
LCLTPGAQSKSVDFRGKADSLLFNYFPVNDQYKAEDARNGFSALLSGRLKSATFEFTSAWNRHLIRDTWTFLRRETLIVDGKPFETIVFSRRAFIVKSQGGWLGNFTLWLDPKNGLWLKSEFHLLNGTVDGTQWFNFRVLSVALPP